MEKKQAIQLMSALAQPTRLDVWHLLVERLPEGMAAGDISRAMGMSKNAMSANFAILSAAGLVTSEKIGRSVVYKAETGTVDGLVAFLTATRGRSADGM